ncbi:MAG TPA: PAS domain S-box protein [Chitinophagaceae bacterium]|jgi:PAS domain S-box-containing protein|nr:PAS domain S-box protein [Chitinophagaceae bacterium]
MGTPLKILLLEDNNTDAVLIERQLKKSDLDFEFRHAANKKDFLNALDEFSADVILSDNSLPGYNATEAVKLVRQRSMHIPFILITGTVSEEFAATIMKLGADDYLLKDRMARLPAAIDAALKQRRFEKEKVEAQKAIIESEEKYRTLVEQAFDGIIIYSTAGAILDCNHTACDYIGYTRKELKKMTIRELFFDEDLRTRPLYFETLKIGHPTYDYRKLKRKDGSYLEMEISTKMMPDGNLMAIARDITEKIAAEQQKEFDSNNLKALINNTKDLMWSVDRDLKLITFNDSFNDTITYMSGQPLVKGGNILSAHFTADQLKKYKTYYKRALNGESFTIIDHFDGPVQIWVEISFYPIRKKDEVIGTACFSRDITERKKTEEKIRLSEISLKQAQAIAHISNWEIDLIQNIHTWSDEFYRIFGLNKAEIVPSAELFLSFIHPDDAAFAQKMVSESLVTFKDASFAFRFIPEDKMVRYGYTEWQFEFDKKKIPIRLFGILQDITERTEAEEELKNLQEDLLNQQRREQIKITATALEAQEKERTAIGIELHDNVNQILVGCLLALSVTKENPEKTQQYVDLAMTHIKEAIEENRKIAHVFVAPDMEGATLTNLLKSLADKMLSPIGIKTKLLFNKFQEDRLYDKQKINIYRIAQEQCTNITKYAKASEVKIALVTTADFFVMEISDNGVGMDSANKITGIGLQNIKGRLSIFNGTSSIETAPGRGFKLEVKIPL